MRGWSKSRTILLARFQSARCGQRCYLGGDILPNQRLIDCVKLQKPELLIVLFPWPESLVIHDVHLWCERNPRLRNWAMFERNLRCFVLFRIWLRMRLVFFRRRYILPLTVSLISLSRLRWRRCALLHCLEFPPVSISCLIILARDLGN
jgi:hypothetical protein